MIKKIEKHYNQSICEQFESQAVRLLGHPAVIFEGHIVDYQTLNEEANQLAYYLMSLNLGSKPLIAISMHRSVEMVVSLLAVLKMGGSYLPIDPDLPESRILYMLENAKASILLSHSPATNKSYVLPIQTIIVDQLKSQLQKQPSLNLNIAILPEDQIYVIYTSGSTGVPKGCMLSNQAVCNRLLWMQEVFDLKEDDRILQKTPFGFDVSVWEFFWPLITGATIVLAKPGGHKDPAYLVDLIRRERISVCHFVPSMLNIFLQEPHIHECSSLRYVMCSGEALKFNTVQAFYSQFSSQLINLYGPTEAAIDVTSWVCDKHNQSHIIPIGKPIKNIEIHILDENLNELPYGGIGEICISGMCLASGYINQEELTNKSFVVNDFGNGKRIRIYRTGDLGRFLEDGNIEYLSRIDDQIKLRGNRIELGEIENLLRTHLAVKDVVVIAVNNNENDGYVAAFVVLHNEITDYEAELKSFIRKQLPEYMVPAKIIGIDKIPLTTNGKVSKKDLIEICDASKQSNSDKGMCQLSFAEDLLNAITEIAKNLLDLNDITSQADLYEMGATSLTMMRLTQMINKRFGLQVPTEVFFQNPTIKSITDHLVKQNLIGQPSNNSCQLNTPLPKNDAIEKSRRESTLQDELLEIASSLLKVKQIDIQDDLFEMGATSFTIMRLSQELHNKYEVQIPADFLLSNPNLTGILSYISDNSPKLKIESAESKSAFDENDTLNECNEAQSNQFISLFSKTELDNFKDKEINLRKCKAEESVLLSSKINSTEFIETRSTKREFTSDTISLEKFSKFLSLLKCETVLNEKKFQYPSAGSIYAVQLYIHIKKNAVEGIDEGIYYYHPKEHKLYLITSKPEISKEIHFYYNRPIYQNAGFSLYFIAQMDAIEPIYGEHSKHFVTIEVGSILQLLMTKQADSDIGLCPVGTINFEAVRPSFKLDGTPLFLQCVLGGSYLCNKTQSENDGFGSNFDNKKLINENNDIAIIGLSGRYPGAKNLDEFWHVLKNGDSQITAVPSERWDYSNYYDPDKGKYGKWGGFIDDVDQFDPLLFNIAPKEAHFIDPQQRLMLMQIWETLEDAGYTSVLLNRNHKKIGVYVGVMWDDYKDIANSLSNNSRTEFSSARHAIANRISYVFDFQGPSVVIDTSCSSALTAIHLACEGIKNGDCNAAIVGGVNLILHPNHLCFLSDINMISHDNKSCAFSENGTGWVPGEGVGSILIKPLPQALKDGDNIYGVIKSSGINHSGRTHQFGMPNPQAQTQLMQSTLEKAGIDPGTIDYIECASSGALLFDSAEYSALASTYTQADSTHKYRMGSVKPNIGHLESAAALSQLTKVLLQMKHRRFVPTIDTDPQSPLINLENSSFLIQKELEEWKPLSNFPLRAAINAFGGAGSYGHLIVESYIPKSSSTEDTGPVVMVLSAATEGQLKVYANRLMNYLKHLDCNLLPPLKNIAYTLQIGRVEMACRAAFVVETIDELVDKLQVFIGGNIPSRSFIGNINSSKDHKKINNLVDLEYIAKNWVKGDQFDWDSLYIDQSITRVSLPTYPFANEKYWLGMNKNLNKCIPNNMPRYSINNRSLLRKNVIDYLKEIFVSVFEIPYSRINEEITLEDYGISSLLVNQLHAKMCINFPQISKTIFFQYKTIGELADYLLLDYFDSLLSMFEYEEITHYVDKEQDQHQDKDQSYKVFYASDSDIEQSKDIAIIGLSGRYPMAGNLEEFWLNLQEGKHCISEIPKERWNYQDFISNEDLTHGNKYCKWGGFLKEIDKFDPLFFNISPREAEKMDPQERLFLEISWEVLEDAGYSQTVLNKNKDSMSSNKVGVFVGVMWSEYPYFAVETQSIAPFPHTAYWSIANRVSYCLNLHGPSIAIDTACSSSLTALHMACESIHSGSSTMAIAGGVNLSLHPNKYLGLCQMGFTSGQGKCQSFGEGGDGYVPSEGVGAVLLKSLRDAITDGDHIYGVIKGSAVNHGGKTNGYTVPDPKAHSILITEALKRASINPRDISYVEAHGTGTVLGDPIEIKGLSDAFKHFTDDKGFCAIGSVKSNIGHAEASAGIAGLTKLLLQFKHNKLVPTLHAENSNKEINFEQTPFYIQQGLTDWEKREKLRYASISSFGAGGSNAHMILADAPEMPISKEVKPYYLIVLSAKNDKAFEQAIKNMITWLKTESNENYNLESISYTLNIGREHFNFRGAWVVKDKGQLLDQLIDSLKTGSDEKYAIGVVNDDKRRENLVYQTAMKVLKDDILSTLSNPEMYKETLTVLSKLYVAGCTPDWSVLHYNESHQKISLPTYPFLRESYWLTDVVANNDSILKYPTLQSNKTRKPLFYQKSWLAMPLDPNETNIKSIVIYEQMTEALAKDLLKRRNDFLCINVSDISSYLSKDLSEYSGWVDLSASCLSNSESSLLALLQKWIESRRSSRSIAMQVTSGLESFGNDKVSLLGAEKVGLYRMLNYEYSYITSLHLDVDLQTDDVGLLTDIVLGELGGRSSGIDVCYRNKVRHISTLKETELPQCQAVNLTFDQSDVLLITGGTRGIGLLLARHFVLTYGVKKLVLMGREQLPARELWSPKVEHPESIARKIKNIQQLEQLGAEIRVLTFPLNDSEINTVVSSMGPIAAVIHAAGCVDNENPAFIRKSIENIGSVLAPKVNGLKNLMEVIDHSNLKYVILCSSISAMIPELAVGLSDYAAANVFMDYFASAYDKTTCVVSIQWPSWKDTGMGEVVSKIYQDSGILSIHDEEGLKFVDQIIFNSLRGTVMPLVIDDSKFDLPKLVHKNVMQQPFQEVPSINYSLQNSTRDDTQHLVQQIVEEELKLKKESLDVNTQFAYYGVDSILLAQIVRKINKALELELNVAHLIEHNTVQKITEWLVENEPNKVSQYFTVSNQPDPIIKMKSEKTAKSHFHSHHIISDKPTVNRDSKDTATFYNEAIAVVGMSCKFPGANSVSEYWDLLTHGKSAISSVPENCWGVKTGYFAALINQVYEFDPGFFMIAKEDAMAMDPQATLLLRESLNAIYDANYTIDEVNASNTGVYIGARSQHQIPENVLMQTRNPIMIFGQNYLAANISQFFNFYGPSVVVDTACSSALVAMNMAVEALQLGKIKQALVAGVNLLTTPFTHRLFEQRKLLQKEGIFHIFDERASGIVLGEGVGAVYLKPLSLAQSDGDKIYAIISGIGINNDGRTPGPATPNMEAQQKVMKAALEYSSCKTTDVKYLDVNGSGSQVTDLLEIKSIDSVYRQEYSAPLYLGSMKPNIGHPLCAEGIASFIKVCLMIHHQTLVPFISGQQPIKHFSLEEKNMLFPRAAQSMSLPYAAINCFADGGTNAHVILKQYQMGIDNKKRPLSNKPIPVNIIDTRLLSAI